MRVSHARSWTRWVGAPLLPLLLALCLGCDETSQSFLPAEILGVWRTDDTRYRTRTLQLESSSVVIGGIEPVSPQRVEKVEMSSESGQTLYTVHLKNEDNTTDSLVFQFNPEGSGELRIRNQQSVVWRRQQTSNVSAPLREREEIEPGVIIYKIDCLRSTCSSTPRRRPGPRE